MELLEEPQDQEEEQSTGDEMWDDLLGSIEYEEPPEEEPTSGLLGKLRERFTKKETPTEGEGDEAIATTARKRFTGRQLIILGVLAVLVVIAYIALAIAVRRTLPTIQADATPTVTATATEILPTPTETPVFEDPTVTPSPTPKVATQYDNNIASAPDDIDLRLKRGNEYLNLRAFDAALDDFEHAMALDEKSPEAYVGIGHANMELMQWNEAENAFLTAVALDEIQPEPRFGLGMLYYHQGRYKAAARSFDIAAETAPTFVEAEAWLAMASAQLKDAPEAQGAATRAISQTQTSAIVYIARAWAYLASDPPDIDAAQGDLLYAHNLARFDFEVLIALAQFYTDYRPERLAEAEQLALAAVDQWSTSPLERARGLHVLGRVYLAQERKDDALDALGRAADIATINREIVLAGLSEDLDRALTP